MKLTPTQLQEVLQPPVVKLADVFTRHDHELRIAGGAVRDLLSGIQPHDLDFATTATPTEMKLMFDKEEIRMINETGEKHGTITARLDEQNFECTTLRVDKVTDGRRAEVEFVKDWQLDAFRRDLTVNSMFLGLDGTVYDYVGGVEHLQNRQVEFVGDAKTRIQEDYLRILRYFRFYGRISKSADDHNEEIIKSIKENASGMDRLAGERIWMELQKIVVGNYAGELIRVMKRCDLMPYIGLSEHFDADAVVVLCRECRDLQPVTVLAAGVTGLHEAVAFVARIKCSKKERDLLTFIVENRDAMFEARDADVKSSDGEKALKLAKDLITEANFLEKVPVGLAQSRACELLKYCRLPDASKVMETWESPRFPVAPRHLMEALEDYRKTAPVRRGVYGVWRDSGYTAGAEELLTSAREIEKTVPDPVKRKKH